MRNNEINLKYVALFLVILVVTLFVAYLAMSALRNRYEKEARRADAAHPAMAAAPSAYFPLPREQPNPVLDLNSVRTQESNQIHSYGWVDRSNSIVHIPIERALELIAQQPGRIQ